MMPLWAVGDSPPAPVSVHALRALPCHKGLGGVRWRSKAGPLCGGGSVVTRRVAEPHEIRSVIWMQRAAILLAFSAQQ